MARGKLRGGIHMPVLTYLRVGAFLHMNTLLYLFLIKLSLDIGLACLE